MEIEFYETEHGAKPALEFLNSLSPKLRTKMMRTVDLLEIYGPMLRFPESKELNDGIMELRTSLGTDAIRVLYFFFIGNKAILTNGFVKKTPKTPRTEIALAKKYRMDYMRRNAQ